MSEVINNREYRQKVLKELIMELHNGKSPEEVKARFADLIEGVSPSEISDMEQNLIMEGMPVQEVQRLCDVHAAVFKGSIEEIHRPQKPEEQPGHPVHTFKMENREIEKLINGKLKNDLDTFKSSDNEQKIYMLIEDLNLLWDIDKHYSRKENILFPYLEKYGITAPPKVMWGVDDEIRDEIKGIKKDLSQNAGSSEEIVRKSEELINRINEMIFKEENILFPMAIDTLSEDEWLKIESDGDEIGYCMTEPKTRWKPNRVNVAKEEANEVEPNGNIDLETGYLSVKEIGAMLNHMPFDITFIDKDDVVKYFSLGKERIFARTKAVIGRTVQNCHPPASVHIVEKMIEDFKAGKKENEDFWIKMGDMYVYIRYFAVRDEKGEYMGTMEVTQNIKPIQDIQGEKRLVSE